MEIALIVVLKLYPQLERLVTYEGGCSWSFHPVSVERDVLLAGARMWPDAWSEAILIKDPDDARGHRCHPDGGEVWKCEGDLVEVIDGLVDLPAPDQPNAPRLVKARAPALWVPGLSGPR